ncbi:hypothetical protein [Aldersonia kunmingensis]|uniref:hypothetical protein n=1 Tax=Aldersonia kunmingensis TaxID=408066 RepID=UPI00082A6BC5|nr:hypothetical protein [Aldersonia kunmingensis]
MTARAGVVSVKRGAIYLAAGVVVTAVICAVVVAVFSGNRFFTGLLIGVVVGIGVTLALFARDSVVLNDVGIVTTTPWAAQRTPWTNVRAARFANEADRTWSLTLDLNEPAGAELPLLRVPPVHHQVGNPYELRKRQQVKRVLAVLHERKIPTTVLPEIQNALEQYWKVS